MSPRTLRLAGTFGGLAIGYYALGSWLSSRGYISLDLLVLAEKSRLALFGAPPRLVNMGFVSPPLPLLLMLPFSNAVVGQAVLAAAVMTCVLAFIVRTIGDVWLRTAAIAFVVASPLFLYLAVEKYDLLLLCVLFGVTVSSIRRYLDEGYSLPLFAAGIAFGLAFFIDYRSILLLPVVVAAVALPVMRRSFSQAVGVAITLSIPAILFALSWMYVNWIFLGDPFAFVDALRASRPAGDFGVALPAALAVTLYIFNAGRARPNALGKCALVVGFAVSCVVLPWSPKTDEQLFGRALFGQPLVANVEQFRDIATLLTEHPEGPILLDDVIFYPVVALNGDTARFVLPYQREFPQAALDPASFARYVVVSPNDSSDQIATLHPSVRDGTLDGFVLADRVGPYAIYRRVADGPYTRYSDAPDAALVQGWELVRLPVTLGLAFALLVLAFSSSRRLTGNVR